MSDETPAKPKRAYVRRPKALAPTPVVLDHSAAIADAMARFADSMAASIAKMSANGLTAADLSQGLADALEQHRIAKLASNPDPNYSPPSVFEPHGTDHKPLPKAALVREIYTNNHPERAVQLRPDEVDAFNLLSASLPNPNMVRKAHGGKWVARTNDDGTRLMITWPCKGEDDRWNAPKGILALCMELTNGTEVPNVDTMLSQMVALQKQNAEIMALLKARPDLQPASMSA